MKLRIQGDSIRIRISAKEAQRIAEGSFVQETTHFPGEKTLHYVLEPSLTSEVMHARFANDRVVVSLPMALAVSWAKSEEVSLETTQTIPEDPSKSLYLLVEKDFDS
ncbi:hypothetical protein BH10BDE1_BH10BDE1_16240 [soil metagenome]